MTNKLEYAKDLVRQVREISSVIKTAKLPNSFLSYLFPNDNTELEMLQEDLKLLQDPDLFVSSMYQASQLINAADRPLESSERFYVPSSVLSGESSNETKYEYLHLDKPNDYDKKITYHIGLAKDKGSSFLPVHASNEYDGENNHWTMIHFAKQNNDEIHVQYFNSHAGYDWVPKHIETTLAKLRTNGCKLTFTNHSTSIQKDSINCAAYSALFAYLCTLKTRSFDTNNKPNDQIFSDLVGETAAPTIAHNIMTNKQEPIDALIELNYKNPSLASDLRLFEMEAYSSDPETLPQLKEQFSLICNRIDAIRSHPIYTLTEKSILVAALLSILVGLVAHIILLTVAGSLGTGSYAGYKAYQYLSGEDGTTAPRISFK